jgi:carboxylesterase type B
MPFEPAVDGDVLPAAPLELIRAGASSGVRLLTGSNREEMTLFLAATGLVEHADDAVLQFTAGMYGLPPDGVDTYRRTRPTASPGQLIIDVVTDWFFRIPAIRVAEARAEALAEPSFVYEFGWRTPQWDGRLGATHGADVAFVFDNLDDPTGKPLLGNTPPQALADEMHRAWVDFITTGDPGWPAYGADRTVMAFAPEIDSTPAPSAPTADPRGETRAAWTGLR